MPPRKRHFRMRLKTDVRLMFVVLAAASSVGLIVFSGMRQLEPLGADPANLQQVTRGQAIYVSACGRCHGEALEGDPNWRIPLSDGSYPAPPHDGTGHTWHHSDELLFRITKHGGQRNRRRRIQKQHASFCRCALRRRDLGGSRLHQKLLARGASAATKGDQPTDIRVRVNLRCVTCEEKCRAPVGLAHGHYCARRARRSPIMCSASISRPPRAE